MWPWDFLIKYKLNEVDPADVLRLNGLGKTIFCPITDTKGKTYQGNDCTYFVGPERPCVKSASGNISYVQYFNNEGKAILKESGDRYDVNNVPAAALAAVPAAVGIGGDPTTPGATLSSNHGGPGPFPSSPDIKQAGIDLYINRIPESVKTQISDISFSASRKKIYFSNNDFKARCMREYATWVKNAYIVFKTDKFQNGVNYRKKISLIKHLDGLVANTKKPFQGFKNFLEGLVGNETTDKMSEFKKRKMDEFKMSLNVEYDKLKIDATKSTIEETLNAQNSADPVAHTRVNELDSAIKQIAGVGDMEEIYNLIKYGSIEYLTPTGGIIQNMKYGDGIHQFIEYKELGHIVSKFTLSFKSYSINRYIRESDIVFGLSGTSGFSTETVGY